MQCIFNKELTFAIFVLNYFFFALNGRFKLLHLNISSNLFHNGYLEDTTNIMVSLSFPCVSIDVCICSINVGLVGVINRKKVKSVEKIGCFSFLETAGK